METGYFLFIRLVWWMVDHPCYLFIRACLARIPPLYHSFDLPYTCLIMRTSSRLNRSYGLRIGGRPAEESESSRIGGGSGSLVVMVDSAPSTDHPSPSSKGKGKISEIRYPSGSEYLKSAMKYANVVGPSRVEPFYEKTFVTCYRPPLGVQVRCLDLLTSYIVQVPKWHASLKRPLRTVSTFLYTPFIKNVLQHFNVCPSQLSPISGVFWSALIVFRDKGLEVPSITLLLDFFSVKEVVEGFLYISKRISARLIIYDLSSSHKHWKERYFFIGGRNWEYNPADRDDMLGILTVWTTLENLREFSFVLVGVSF